MLDADYIEITVPQSNVNDEHVRVTEWHYASGEKVEKGSIVAELETSKAAFDLEAEREGFLHYEAATGEEILVGELIATIGDRSEKPEVWLQQAKEKATKPGSPAITAKARKLMAKHGLANAAIVMRMTGCPNGCARPFVAEIGLIGKGPGRYNLMLGGDGKGRRLNKLYRENLDEATLLSNLDGLLARYAGERNPDERFGDFVIRSGIVAAVLDPAEDFHD